MNLWRIKCWLNHVAAKCRGIKWDGHCWDVDPEGVRCVDCRKLEKTAA